MGRTSGGSTRVTNGAVGGHIEEASGGGEVQGRLAPHGQDLAKLGHGGRHPGRQILGLNQVEHESMGLKKRQVFTGQGFIRGVTDINRLLEYF